MSMTREECLELDDIDKGRICPDCGERYRRYAGSRTEPAEKACRCGVWNEAYGFEPNEDEEE